MSSMRAPSSWYDERTFAECSARIGIVDPQTKFSTISP